MRTPVYTNRFEKDLKLMIKRGSDPESIKSVVRKLIAKYHWNANTGIIS